jgi:hypothetical protein
MFCTCGCDPKKFSQLFEKEIEETKDGIIIKLKARDKEKAEALKNLISASKTLFGEDCCC